METYQLFLSFLAALAAGFTNAIAGGGTLITFPVLTAIGLPAITANVTNTIALCPGYIGGIFSQRKEFQEQKKKIIKILPFSIIGGILGGLILLNTSETSFRNIIPYLILFATILLAIQTPLKRWINLLHAKSKKGKSKLIGMMLMLFLTAVYGGYFGAGISIIVFAILSLVTDDSPHKINVLKQMISFSINFTAAIYFSFFGHVEWMIVLIMVFGSIMGVFLGWKLAGKMNPLTLKWIVVFIGLVVSMIYFVK